MLEISIKCRFLYKTNEKRMKVEKIVKNILY